MHWGLSSARVSMAQHGLALAPREKEVPELSILQTNRGEPGYCMARHGSHSCEPRDSLREGVKLLMLKTRESWPCGCVWEQPERQSWLLRGAVELEQPAKIKVDSVKELSMTELLNKTTFTCLCPRRVFFQLSAHLPTPLGPWLGLKPDPGPYN